MNVDRFNIPLTLEEMTFAAKVFNAQITNKAPVPEIFGKEPPQDGNAYLMLTNVPLNRANVAVINAFKDDRQKGMALAFRLISLPDFLEDPRADDWVRKSNDGSDLLHANIFEALAKYEITDDDEKNASNFFEELERLEKPEDEPTSEELNA